MFRWQDTHLRFLREKEHNQKDTEESYYWQHQAHKQIQIRCWEQHVDEDDWSDDDHCVEANREEGRIEVIEKDEENLEVALQPHMPFRSLVLPSAESESVNAC